MSMQCSIDSVDGDEARLEAARLISAWREFRDRPDCAGALAAQAAAVAYLGEHFEDEPVCDFTGLVVMIDPGDEARLWCFFPTEI